MLVALVTVLALGFEPFLQQVLNTVVRETPITSQPASIRTPTSYNESMSGNLGGSGLSLNALIGAFGGAEGAIPSPICPSGNCTWPAYNTLAMCTMCTEMTDKVTLSGDVYNLNLTSRFEDFAQSNDTSTSTIWTPSYSFPSGNPVNVSVELDLTLGSSVQWFVDYPRRVVWPLNISPAPNSQWSDSWDNKSYAGVPSPLLAMGYLDIDTSSTFDQLVVQRATECAFMPCVRTMDTSVRSGATISNATATNYGSIVMNAQLPDGRTVTGWNTTINSTNYFAYDAGTGDVQGRAYLLVQALRIALEGNTTYGYGGYWYSDPAEQDDIFNFSSTGFTQTSGPWSSAGQQAIDGNGNFSDIVDGVGRALTGRFQQLQDTVAIGTTLHSEAVIVVRWQWISYPLALVILGLAGLLSTILSTHHNHMAVWKESTLPLLFRYTAPLETQQAHTPGGLARPNTTFSFSNTIPGPDSNKVSSIVTQASEEQVQLRRRDAFWVLDSEPDPIRNKERSTHELLPLRV